MKFVTILALLGTWVASTSASAYCSDCRSYWSCTAPDTPKSFSYLSTAYCGYSCSDCSSYDCCDDKCYKDDTRTELVDAVSCPYSCCSGDLCGDQGDCDLSKAVNNAITILIISMVVCMIVFVCIPIAICFFCGFACFQSRNHHTTTVIASPGAPAYSNMGGYPQPGGYPPQGYPPQGYAPQGPVTGYPVQGQPMPGPMATPPGGPIAYNPGPGVPIKG